MNQNEQLEGNAVNNAPWYIQVASTFGVPVAILCALSWGLWAVVAWLGTEAQLFKKDVVMPVVAKHLEFLGKTTESISALEKSTAKISESLRTHETAITRNQEMILVNQALIRETAKATSEQVEVVREETIENRNIYLQNLDDDRKSTKEMIQILKSIDAKAGSIDDKTIMP